MLVAPADAEGAAPLAMRLQQEWACGWTPRALAVRHDQHPQAIVRVLLGPAGWLTLLGLALTGPRAVAARLRAEQQLAHAAQQAGLPREPLRAAALAAIRDGRVPLAAVVPGARLTMGQASGLWGAALAAGIEATRRQKEAA